MSHELATAWWKSKFNEAKEVTYDQLISQLQNRFHEQSNLIPIIVPLLIDADYNFKVKLDEFEFFVKRLGDFNSAIPNCAKNFFDNGELCNWWHGKMDRDEANKLIGKYKEQGSFLLRFSTKPDSFALAYNRIKSGTAEVKNVLIECTNQGYKIQGENLFYESIGDLIKQSEHTKRVVPFTRHVSERLRLIREGKYTKDAIEALEAEWQKQHDSKYVTVGQQPSSGAYGAIGASGSSHSGDHAAPSGAYGAIGASGSSHGGDHAAPGNAYGAIGSGAADAGVDAAPGGAYGAIGAGSAAPSDGSPYAPISK